jgi:acetyltransferase-like isoleucine patch superfamily enzyme
VNWSSITLEGPVALDRGVVLLIGGAETPGKLVIHSGTYVNRYTIFDAHQRVVIGHNCMIGPNCYITDADHGTAAGRLVHEQPMKISEVCLGDDVWLGAGVTILPGVRIGSGTVVGAGAVVTKNLPDNVIAVGVPARVIGKRTGEQDREWLAAATSPVGAP